MWRLLGTISSWLLRGGQPASDPRSSRVSASFGLPAGMPAVELAWSWPSSEGDTRLSDRGPATRLARLLFSGRAPSGLCVHGPLCLAGLRIRSLPADLTVEGDLDLRQCQRLRKLGRRLRVHGSLKIGGALPLPHWDLERGAILAGREGFRVSRGRQVPLTALPEGLDVTGDLELRDCVRLDASQEFLRRWFRVYLGL